MPTSKKLQKTCSRGHVFYKSIDCPVCPKCWPGYYRDKAKSDFPSNLSAPALRGLLAAKITNLSQVAKYTEHELLSLHGVGPNAIKKLQAALQGKGLSFKKTNSPHLSDNSSLSS